MPVWRMQCALQADSLFPADACIITPHFHDAGPTSDPATLANDLATALQTYWGATKQLTVKAYDAEGTPPVYPAATVVKNPGLAGSTDCVREAAVCLSFRGSVNRPSMRGRLYLPSFTLGTASTNAPRPSSAMRTKVGQLVPILTGLGGVDVDWVVWSRKEQTAHPVQYWWVDDAWDIQRSRGLRPTVRTEGNVSE